MREIKFRGISKCMFADGWMYGHYYLNDRDMHIIDDCKVDPATIGQFTGLHDRNGKEIYEGDVIRHSYYSAMWRERLTTEEIIQWDDEHAGFNLRKRDARNYEILGNIHEQGSDQ